MTKLELVADNSIQHLNQVKLWKAYLKKWGNKQLTFEEWRKKIYGK
jgi:hypothetical protein